MQIPRPICTSRISHYTIEILGFGYGFKLRRHFCVIFLRLVAQEDHAEDAGKRKIDQDIGDSFAVDVILTGLHNLLSSVYYLVK